MAPLSGGIRSVARCLASLLFVSLCLAAALPAEVFALAYNPTAMTFSAAQGTNPTPQTLTFWRSSVSERGWSVSSPVSWMTVSPGSGTLSSNSDRDQIQVSINSSRLAPGSYSSSVMVRIVNANGTTRVTAVPVTVTVAGTPPVINLAPAALTFSATAGGANPAGQTITVSNTGGGTLSWTANDNAAWLSLSPVSGTNNGTMTATVNTAGLAAGTYSAAVTVSGSGATAKTIPVTLTLAAPATAPAISFSRASLAFTGTVGGANPAAQSFTISNSGGGTLTWSVTDSAAWLSLSPVSGTNSGTVTASVNLSGLAAGTYNATITATATGATPRTLPVTLTVTSTTSASIWVNPSTPTFSGAANGANPAPQTLAINSSGGALAWTATDNAPWLSLSPTSGSTPGSLTMTVSTAGLAAGTYNGLITITAPNATNNPQYVPVTLTVSASSAPVISLSQTALSFSATAGGSNPAAQTVGVTNTGGGTLSWTATDNAAWLSISPTSGTNAGSITASVNTSGLAAGTYNAAITVSASGATAKTVTVSLVVSASTTPVIGLSPTALSFSATAGGTNPANKTLSVSNAGGGTLRWTASDNANWLSVSPASGTNAGTVTVSVNTNGLAAGTHNATITLSATGATTKTVPVTLTLSAPNTGSATLMWNANTDSDLAGYKIYRATASGAYGAPIATVGKTVTSYTASGLQNGTTYFFVITAYDTAGNESSYSNEVSKSIF